MDEAQNRVLNGQSFSEHDHSHMLSQYDGGIAYIDAQIGHLTSWLKERNLYDNTLLVITSDHGEAFGEKNLVLHGNSVYQNLVHVALMIKFPKNGQTGVINEPVSLIDVAPTILASVGFPADPKMQGRNLLTREPQAKRDLFTESFQCPVPHPPECPPGGCSGRAVLAWPYKLVTSSTGKRELYDVSMDPEEKHDLAAEREAIASELGSQLKTWAKTMPARPKEKLHLDGESIQRLKSLGYVQ
jgi:arylsulfatase A-like enzyme